ncbi:MAG TPA: 2-phosphosulfolactate phosphatase [Candidatus Dormibacteraeota bacterium]|nr:2-phosphosulfolactate phosphatase [Candidatus Dormibacteraeota bacterium]
MNRTFVIDSLPERAIRYRDTHAIAVVDVFRATTVIVTALACGHRVYPVATITEAMTFAAQLKNPILAGEQAGVKPPGFDLNNSPAAVALLDSSDPIVLLSSAGTQLLAHAKGASAIYVACLRNFTATANDIASGGRRVALIGAGTRGEARPEDQMVCAWIGQRLLQHGFRPENESTILEMAVWDGVAAEVIMSSPSVDYLRETQQTNDIDFVLGHVDDLDAIALYNGQQVRLLPAEDRAGLAVHAT